MFFRESLTLLDVYVKKTIGISIEGLDKTSKNRNFNLDLAQKPWFPRCNVTYFEGIYTTPISNE